MVQAVGHDALAVLVHLGGGGGRLVQRVGESSVHDLVSDEPCLGFDKLDKLGDVAASLGGVHVDDGLVACVYLAAHGGQVGGVVVAEQKRSRAVHHEDGAGHDHDLVTRARDDRCGGCGDSLNLHGDGGGERLEHVVDCQTSKEVSTATVEVDGDVARVLNLVQFLVELLDADVDTIERFARPVVLGRFLHHLAVEGYLGFAAPEVRHVEHGCHGLGFIRLEQSGHSRPPLLNQ